MKKKSGLEEWLELTYAYIKPHADAGGTAQTTSGTLGDVLAGHRLECAKRFEIYFIVELGNGQDAVEENGSFQLLCTNTETCKQQCCCNY